MRRTLAALALAAVSLLTTAPAAVAVDNPAQGCQLTSEQCQDLPGSKNKAAGVVVHDDVPPLQRPDVVASLVTCDLEHPAPAGDPFAQGSKVTLFSQYCYAGYATVGTYDLGIVDKTLNEPESRFDAALLEPAVTATTAADGLWAQAFDPSWLDVFERLAATAVDHIDPLVRRYMPLAMLVAVVVLARVASDGDPVKAGTGLVLSALCLVVALAALQFPMGVARTAQSTLEAVSVQMNSSVENGVPAADSAAGRASEATLREVHYRGFLRRSFGSPDIPAAQRFGPALFRAGTMTVHENRVCRTDVAACQRIYDDHAAAFKRVARQVEEFDPIAYQALQGRKSRTWATLLELAGALVAALVRSVCAGLVIVAVMALVLLVLALPVTALVGVVQAARGNLGVVSGVGGAMWNAFTAGAVSAVVGPLFAAAVGAILSDTTLPGWFALGVLFGLSVLVLSLLRPWERLQAMTSVSRSDVNRVRRRGRVLSRMAYLAADKFLDYQVSKKATGEALEDDREAATVEPATAPRPAAPPMPPMVERPALPAAPRRWVADAPSPDGGAVLPGRVVTDDAGRDVWVADLGDVYVPGRAK